MLDDGVVDANIADQHGWSGLHWAASQNHSDILQLLLQKGAEINAIDQVHPTAALLFHELRLTSLSTQINGWTALHVAVVRESVPCVQLLLSSGAEPRIRDLYGDSVVECLQAARRKSKLQMLQLLQDARNHSGRPLRGRAERAHVVLLVVLLHLDRLAVLLQVELERLHVAVEAQRAHGPDDVVAVDGLALLLLALVAGLARDERDELAHALLHRLLAVLGDLGRGRQRHLHDARDVGGGQEAVLLADLVVVVLLLAGHAARLGNASFGARSLVLCMQLPRGKAGGGSAAGLEEKTFEFSANGR
ncbi:hypothetical protein ON010_g16597 [Phytophthora cinnamomi]|nr:hypothetical protein ON010_g16597 [Phytophthora cinnamomi]